MTVVVTTAVPRLTLPVGDDVVDSADRITVMDKYLGQPAYEVAAATAEHVDAAVRAGRIAVAAPLPAHRRAQILADAAAGLLAHADELVETLIAEGGKPRRASQAEVRRSAETLQWSAEEAKRIAGEAFGLDATPDGVGRFAITLRQPVGVVAAITPTNSPLNLVAHKVGPALAAGNAVVLKPPQATPVCALLLHRILVAAGLPPGHLSVLVGPGVGEALLRHPGVDFYTFTGSAEVGAHLRRTVGLRDALLELGGNSPVIVHDDADVARAATACATGGFTAAGQACTAVQRVYVHARVEAEFTAALVAATEALGVGDPRDPATDVGPMLTDAEADRVAARVDEALRAGARRRTGGRRDGRVLWPTVLTHVAVDQRVHREEIFGPVVVVEPYDDLDAVIAAANDSPYGLHAAVFTRSLDVAFAALQRLEAGAVLVNESTRWRTEFVPFGGMKESGTGREGPRYAIERMTRLKVGMFALTDPVTHR